MKKLLLILLFVAACIGMQAQGTDITGLWQVNDLVWDGSVLRMNNLYLETTGDLVRFSDEGDVVAEGNLRNDTVFITSGFEGHVIDWIRIIDQDTMISSLPMLESSDGLKFIRIDLSGIWVKAEYWHGGDYHLDTFALVQQHDTVYFYAEDTLSARGRHKRDSLELMEGFEGIGIDFFRVYSNDYFYIMAPLLESIDQVVFSRLADPSAIPFRDPAFMPDLKIYPVPAGDHLNLEIRGNCLENVRLFSPDGHLLYEKTCRDQHLTLDLSAYRQGLYILEVTVPGGRVVRTIVKE